MDKLKSKKGLQYLKNLLCLTEVQWDVYDLFFAQTNDYQYLVSHLERKFSDCSKVVLLL